VVCWAVKYFSKIPAQATVETIVESLRRAFKITER
jgi:hypothetical protein